MHRQLTPLIHFLNLNLITCENNITTKSVDMSGTKWRQYQKWTEVLSMIAETHDSAS